MVKKSRVTVPYEQVPDACPSGGQNIDKRSAASIQRHSAPKHLPYAGRKRPGCR